MHKTQNSEPELFRPDAVGVWGGGEKCHHRVSEEVW